MWRRFDSSHPSFLFTGVMPSESAFVVALAAVLLLFAIFLWLLRHCAASDHPCTCDSVDEILYGGCRLEGVGTALGAYEAIFDTNKTRKGPASGIIIFVPGNPGLPGWYAEFLAAVTARVNAEGMVLGLAGHISWANARRLRGSSDEGRCYTIDEQLTHVTERIRTFCNKGRQRIIHGDEAGRVTLIGHSIGGWLALQAALRLQSEAWRPRVVLLMPFLEVPASLRALPLSFRLEYHVLTSCIGPLLVHVFGNLATLIRCAPPSLKTALLPTEVRKRFTPACHRLVRDGLVHRDALHNIVRLVQTELHRLGSPYDFEAGASALAASGGLRACFVPGDKWGPLTMASLCSAAGVPVDVLESTLEVPMKHAFSVQAASCARVVEWTVGVLGEMQAGAGGEGACRLVQKAGGRKRSCAQSPTY